MIQIFSNSLQLRTVTHSADCLSVYLPLINQFMSSFEEFKITEISSNFKHEKCETPQILLKLYKYRGTCGINGSFFQARMEGAYEKSPQFLN